MTGIALTTSADMRHRLHLGVLGKVGATVARRTQAGQPAVIHGGRIPGDETADVAGVTLGDAGNVIGRTRQGIGKYI